jgi:hypothetical protein
VDALSSLGDAKSSLGGAKSSLGDAQSSLGGAKSSLGDAKSSLGDAKSSLGDQGKLVALELLKSLLEHISDYRKASVPVLMGLKQHLCLALLHNCLTPTPAIYAVRSSQ